MYVTIALSIGKKGTMTKNCDIAEVGLKILEINW